MTMNEKKKHPILDTRRDIYRCAAQEMRAIFGDIGVMTFIFLVPLAYPLLYTFLYTNETVREVPTVAVDESPTPLSREFIRMVDASPDVKIAYRAADLTQAQQLLARKKAYGIVYIPSDFEKKIARGEQTTVSLYCDMSSLLYYKALLATLTDVSLEMGREIEIQNMAGASREEELTSSMPIENRWTTMYNVHSGFAAFLIPAILMVILQQTMLLGIGMTTGTARQERDGALIFAPAAGTVRAQLEWSDAQSVPLEETVLQPTGRYTVRYRLSAAGQNWTLPSVQPPEQALERTRHLQPELLGLPLPCSVEETTFYEQQPQLLRRTEAQALALARLHSLQTLYTAFPDAVLIARKEDTSCTDTTLEYTAVYTLEADICTQNDPGS